MQIPVFKKVLTFFNSKKLSFILVERKGNRTEEILYLGLYYTTTNISLVFIILPQTPVKHKNHKKGSLSHISFVVTL